MDFNIQESQKVAIGNMLNLSQQVNNSSGGSSTGSYGANKNNVWILEGPHIWKVLIYDKMGQTILSPLMKVGSLRHHGVTLHIQLNAQKSNIPEVPALYFIKPTQENIDKLCEDLRNLYYESYYVNFISPCTDKLLEYFAKKALETGNANRITKVIDRYLDFVSLSPTKFSLGMDKVYSEFFNSKTTDTKIQSIIDGIVTGLICVLSSLGTIPIIRCSNKQFSSSQMIAKELDKRIREILRESNNNFININSNNRPVLILLDRDIDLSTMINHSWIYQGLIHDVYNLKLNRITIDDSNSGKKVFDLDSNDEFWIKHSGEHFTQVANSVSEMLGEYNKKLSELNYNSEDSSQMATNLAVAIHALPEMTEKKRSIDTHTNIATKLVEEIKKRELDKFFEVEESFDNIPTISGCISELETLFNSESSKNFLENDKLRVVLSLLLHERHGQNITHQQLEQLIKLFNSEQSNSIKIIRYIYKSQIQTKNASGVGGFSSNLNNQDLSSTLGHSTTHSKQETSLENNLSKTGITSLAKNVGGKVFDMAGKNILQGVRALLPINKTLKVTSVVDNIMEKKSFSSSQLSTGSSNLDDEFLYFDPKQPCMHDQDSSKVSRIKVSPKQGIVFIIGGGNFTEAHDVLNYAKKTQKSIIYGCTEFINPSEFIKELDTIAS
ncbi:SEC1 family protein [Cryptosporidium ubiquitum]|uniref:SEC1 family protein n=1 Tax=Cryptosporidium ubiquitum TaxID=857276 RepID=A0A1J4MRM8_9CRYT|nr:SEC1 family protein [Cryptosporidium ubiquitum]OII75549.1 SEC1 family protein [Cryptosporidium ubiquitum]